MEHREHREHGGEHSYTKHHATDHGDTHHQLLIMSINRFSNANMHGAFLDINWLWGIRLEYLFIYLAVMFFLSYMYLLNQYYLQRWIYTVAL